MYEHLPGGEILEPGLRDLAAGVRSVCALLVMIAAPRLMRCGIQIPSASFPSALPEHELTIFWSPSMARKPTASIGHYCAAS